MAKIPGICIGFTLLMVFLLVITASHVLAGGEGSCPIEECPNECGRRCSEASRHDRCVKYCNICCTTCLCVPSGTYGHKEECPCYKNLKSSKGTSKCP